jgi:hypothetical protein
VKMKFFIVFLSFALTVKGIILNCNYVSKSFTQVEGNLFGCTVTLISVGTIADIEELKGTLAAGKTLEDVEHISAARKTMITIPLNLEDFFPNLRAIQLYQMSLETISMEDLKPFPNLEHLNLAANVLTSIPFNLFDFNPKLKLIYLYNNKIATVGQGILDGLNVLVDVQFGGNVCIKSDATTPEELELIKQELLEKCLPAGETIAPKTTTLPTTTPTTTITEASTASKPTTTPTPTTLSPETTTINCEHRCTLNEEVDDLQTSLESVVTLAGKLQLDLENLKLNYTSLQAESKNITVKISELEKRDCSACNGHEQMKLKVWEILEKGVLLACFVKLLHGL